MTGLQLYQAGRLDDAIEALGSEVRDHPSDAQRRAFLFELLCFAGNFDRAEKQLNVLGTGSKEAEMGALLYHGALHADRVRQDMFRSKAFPASVPPRTVAGTLNGSPFETISDADPRIGARLEIFAAGQYMWLPFEQIASVTMQAPKRLRDLLWAPALVRPSESYKGLEIGEVMIPVIAPLTWQESDG
ncbi:MAG TPA: type VI secretion system accessory protein TagJ, partial [Gemmatimonadaceae bacterium]|nr:type VI secretion system accessory protein TagJ [Gemmatimonadaceae bacterium]